jgi:hypothetical protein
MNSNVTRENSGRRFGRVHLTALASAAMLAISVAATASAVGTPTFFTNTVEDTQFFAFTSSVCGFPVYEHDTGTVTTMVTTLPDGSVKAHDVVVKITVTFFSTDPAHPGTVTTRPSGPFIEIDHSDGTVTMNSIGQNGHVTMAGQGIVWSSSGITKVEIDASGNVTEVQHGNFSEDHTGICPLL